jgi:hypothetical protein
MVSAAEISGGASEEADFAFAKRAESKSLWLLLAIGEIVFLPWFEFHIRE